MTQLTNTQVIALGLGKAILANDAPAIGAGVSALSMELGGIELIDQPMSAAAQTLYLLTLVLAQGAPKPDGAPRLQIVGVHGVPQDS